MLEIFDIYGIVDIRVNKQNAQIYYNKDKNIWEMFLSNGSIKEFNDKQEAIVIGINWVTRG